MYKIEKGRNKKFEEYKLFDEESSTSAVVNPENGGMLISLKKGDFEYIYLDEDNFYYGEKPSTANPICFPIVGKLEDDKYYYNNKEYKMPQHGLARRNDWKIKSYKTDNDARITLSLEANEETKKTYPFDFNLEFTYILKGNTLTIEQVYENKGEEDMPFSFGFHPYFRISAIENVKFFVDAKECSLIEEGIDNFKEIDYREFKLNMGDYEGQRIFTGAKNEISLLDEKNNREVKVKFDHNYPVAVFWSLTGKNFVCMEPWSSIRNSLNNEDHAILGAGEKKIAKISIEIC